MSYFEQKKAILEDNVIYTQALLENLDGQVIALKNRYDYDLKILNDKIEHAQDIEKNNIERIKDLDKKIKAKYLFYDIRTGKAYKTEKGMYKAQMSAKHKEEEVPEEAEPTKESATLDELLDVKEE